MLTPADIVEEQELKELIINELICKYNNQSDLWIKPELMDRYMIVRNRNETSRREDYSTICQNQMITSLHLEE